MNGLRKLKKLKVFNTNVYDWATGDILLGVTLRWTSIPSRGSSNTLSSVILQKPS